MSTQVDPLIQEWWDSRNKPASFWGRAIEQRSQEVHVLAASWQ